jgi:hypothetical protein
MDEPWILRKMQRASAMKSRGVAGNKMVHTWSGGTCNAIAAAAFMRGEEVSSLPPLFGRNYK